MTPRGPYGAGWPLVVVWLLTLVGLDDVVRGMLSRLGERSGSRANPA